MISVSVSQVGAQHCVWYGECDRSEKVPEKKYNCNYTGPPLPLPSEGLDLLEVLGGLSSVILLLLHDSKGTFLQSRVLRLVFVCRSFVLGILMGTEASAATLISCLPSKGVCSCPFSSCLGMYPVSKLFHETNDMQPLKNCCFGT